MSTGKSYTTQQLIEFERNVLKTLKWKIQFPNMSFWCNYITVRWDEYAKMFSEEYAYDINWQNKKLPIHRNQTNQEYHMFRNLYQILDIISLDIEILKYSQKLIVVSVMYLNIGMLLKYFSQEDIITNFSKNINTFSNYYELNVIFNRFLNYFLEIELEDIIEHILYVSLFFNLQFDYSTVDLSPDEENQIVFIINSRHMKSFSNFKLIIKRICKLSNISIE